MIQARPFPGPVRIVFDPLQWERCQNVRLRNSRRTTRGDIAPPDVSQSHYWIKRHPEGSSGGSASGGSTMEYDYTYYVVLDPDDGIDEGSLLLGWDLLSWDGLGRGSFLLGQDLLS